METVLDNLRQYFSVTAPDMIFKVAAALLVVVVGFWLVKWPVKLFNRSILFGKMEKGVAVFIRTTMVVLLKALVLFTAAAVIGIPTATIVTLIGSLGLAIGLALQGSLTNLAGGLLIVIFKNFKIGDFIELASGESGTVTDVGIFYTTLLTLDNSNIVIPNGGISNQAVTNRSSHPLRRLELKFNIDIGADRHLLTKLVEEEALNHPLVLRDRDAFVKMSGFSEGGQTLLMRVWCKTEDYWTLYYDLYETIKDAFDSHGIKMQLPQLQVNLSGDEERAR